MSYLVTKSPRSYVCRFRKDVDISLLDSEQLAHGLLISDKEIDSLRFDLEMFFDEPERDTRAFNYILRRNGEYEVDIFVDSNLSRRERTVFFMNKLNYVELGEGESAEDIIREKLQIPRESQPLTPIG